MKNSRESVCFLTPKGNIECKSPLRAEVERKGEQRWETKARRMRTLDVDVRGDPELDAQHVVVANMAVDLPQGEIYHLFVNPAFRNKGIGTAMLQFAEQEIKKYGDAKTVQVLIGDHYMSRPEVAKHYFRHGYSPTCRQSMFCPVMAKQL